MKIKLAEICDAPLIHHLMMNAFMEYKNVVPPSSALDETVESITKAMEDGEQALIGYMEDVPVAMVRFYMKDDCVYFFRLSVIPEKQGKGIAKEVLKVLEDYSAQKEIHKIRCKVRMNVPKNIKLYTSLEFKIYDEEVVRKPDGIGIQVVSMRKLLI